MTASTAAVVMSSPSHPPTINVNTPSLSVASSTNSGAGSSPRKPNLQEKNNQVSRPAASPTPKPPPLKPHQELLQQESQQQESSGSTGTAERSPLQPQRIIDELSQSQAQAHRPPAITPASPVSNPHQKSQVAPASPKSNKPTNSETKGAPSVSSTTAHNGSSPVKTSSGSVPSSASTQGRRSSGASDAASDGSGEIIGEYVLGDTIGKGTFGKVKLGLHLITGEKVAVKILEKKRIVQIADVERVAREIKILKRNRHMNVIQLFEVIDSPERIFLVMEHIDGGEMFEYIVAHHRLRESEASLLFRQIAEGLAYLHTNEVTHRDLKPENLLLQSIACPQPGGASFIVKIVDFGLSNTHDGGRLLRTACGSPCYAAPEMIEGKMYRGPMADVWSLGVVLFAMVCGFLPFEDSNTNLLYKKILSADYRMPPFLSPAVQDLIRRIFETDPEKRIPLDSIRQHAWVIGRGLGNGTSAPNTPRSISVPTLPTSSSASSACGNEGAVPGSNGGELSSVLKEMVLTQLDALGVNTVDVEAALKQNAHNSLTASYYLLYNKFQRALKERRGSSSSVLGSITQNQGVSSSRGPPARPQTMRHSADNHGRQINSNTPRGPKPVHPSPADLTVSSVRTSGAQTSLVETTGAGTSTTNKRPSDATVTTPRRVLPPQTHPQAQQQTSVQQTLPQQEVRNGAPPHRPGSVRSGRHIVSTTGGNTASQMYSVGPNPPPSHAPSDRGSVGFPVPRAPASSKTSITNSAAGSGIKTAGPNDSSSSRSHVSNAMVTLKPLPNGPRPEFPPSVGTQGRISDRRHTVNVDDPMPQSSTQVSRTTPVTMTPVKPTTVESSSTEHPSSQSTIVTSSGSSVIRRRPHPPTPTGAAPSVVASQSSQLQRPATPNGSSSRPPSSTSSKPDDTSSTAVSTAARVANTKEDDTRVPQRIPVIQRRPSTRSGDRPS